MPDYSNVILGVSGSIAAYKAAHLTRLLVKSEAAVQVLMTEAATGFITPLTLSTLSKRPVFSSVHADEAWNNHVEPGLWADALLIAPASANTLAKMAAGICDNILTAVYLSARCPVFVAPAMDVDMWHHPSTRRNIATLESYGVHIIPVGHGELASGLVGDGRMAEPETIVAFLDNFFQKNLPLQGKKALVTAGPTHEPLDPVRFIGNHSSGKMGIAVAEELARQGATVDLVLGPTHLRPTDPRVKVHNVGSAQEMFAVCEGLFAGMDIAVLAAAVADYRPAQYSDTKIKKRTDEMQIALAKTVDIAATLGKIKKSHQIFVGFALETDREKEHAQEKLERKNFDFIVLNSLRDAGAGFGHDTNKISIYRRDGSGTTFDLKSKKAAAQDIVTEIIRAANHEA
ncbi:MAG: bifunctional phosphopantothenoylcysteine decarboxylase/phosphopantothenate--cysteine ligase CoaBC [Lewinellaceae bacterium]|nr:bifunctional phosphopantothenoylcysteine decarboxylase/phosphopantothenate--cysteine ligase CoaBC [Lewinellaceae bacterium]